MRLIEVEEGNHLVAEEDLKARVADLDLAQSDGGNPRKALVSRKSRPG